MTFRVWALLLLAPLAMAAPPNDDFANRLTISGDLPLAIASDSTGATREDADQTNWLRTLWFEWQAPTSGLHAIHVLEKNLDWHIRVIGPGGDIAGNRYWSHRPDTGMTYVHAQAGVIYQIMVALSGEAPFTLALRHGLTSQANPVLLGDATPVSAQRGQTSSAEIMTWQWTAPSDGLYILDYHDGLALTRTLPSYSIVPTNGGTIEPLFFDWYAEHASGSGSWYFRARGGVTYTISTSNPEAAFRLDRIPDIDNLTPETGTALGNPATFAVSGHTAQANLTELVTFAGFLSSIGAQWWQWQAPASGTYRITTIPLRGETDDWWYPAEGWLFRLTPTGELTSVATIPVGFPFDDGAHFTSESIVRVEEGEPLYLGLLNVLEGAGPYRPGHWQIDVRPEPALPNDHFENAVPLVADAPEWTRAQAFFATFEPHEPIPELGPEFFGYHINATEAGSVWWTWTAPDATPVSLSAIWGKLEVFQGSSLSTLTHVTPLAIGRTGQSLAFRPEPGVQYHIRTSGLNATTNVLLRTRPDLAAPPANDHFEDATLIQLSLGDPDLSFPASVANATVQPNEPTTEPRSRWWRWTAQDDALLSLFMTFGNIAVYQGDTLADLAPEENWGRQIDAERTDRFLLRAQAGTTYHISLSDGLESLSAWDFQWLLRPLANPPGDQRSSPLTLLRKTSHYDPVPLIPNSSDAQATIDDPSELNSPHPGARQTLWLRWLCDTDQPVLLRLRESGYHANFRAHVYLGDQLLPTSMRSPDDSPAWLIFTGHPGNTYDIAITNLPAGREANASLIHAPQGQLNRDAWLASFPGLTEVSELASPARDGVSNLMKRALGLNPLLHLTVDPARGNIPQLTTLDDGQRALVYRPDLVTDPTLRIEGEAGSNLRHWPQRINPTDLGDGRFAIILPPDHDLAFLRLRVSPGP